MDFLSIKIGLYRNKYISIQVFIIIVIIVIVAASLSYQIGAVRGMGDWELVTGD